MTNDINNSGYLIRCSSDLAKIWHQNKQELNFERRSDEDFLLFLLYQTVQSLTNNFSDTVVLPDNVYKSRIPMSIPLQQQSQQQHTQSQQHTQQPQQPQQTQEQRQEPPPPPPVYTGSDIIDTSSLNTPRTPLNTNGSNMFECERCKKSFNTKAYLGKHLKRCGMNPMKMHHCQHCNIVCHSMGQLNLHIKQRHRDIRYSCDQCHKKFKNQEYVKHHIRVTHNKIKDHKCQQCEKMFTQKGSLQIHMKMVHQKLKDHICRICSRPFGCKSHLTRHMTKIHSNIRNMTCDICNQVFKTPLEMSTHVKDAHYHTEFICNICSKTFRLKHTLAQHISKCHPRETNVPMSIPAINIPSVKLTSTNTKLSPDIRVPDSITSLGNLANVAVSEAGLQDYKLHDYKSNLGIQRPSSSISLIPRPPSSLGNMDRISDTDLNRVSEMSRLTDLPRISEMSRITDMSRLNDMQRISEMQRVSDMQRISDMQRVNDMQRISDMQRVSDLSRVNESNINIPTSNIG